MVASLDRGTPIKTPTYHNPSYRNAQKGTAPISGNPKVDELAKGHCHHQLSSILFGDTMVPIIE